MKINIHKPCPENWDNMQESEEGKFCEICSKCVIDFTEKTDPEIVRILANSKSNEICGKIASKSFSKIAASIILITNLTFVQAQTQSDFAIENEQKILSTTQLSGKLIFKQTKKAIEGADVFFICKSRYIRTVTDENGNFTLEIPNELIDKKNLLYFNFDKLNQEIQDNPKRIVPNVMNGDIYENTSFVFIQKENMRDKEFEIDVKQYYLGGISIGSHNVYINYFDGKKISESQFEKIRKENPHYQSFYFDGEEAKAVSDKGFVTTVSLLFSN